MEAELVLDVSAIAKWFVEEAGADLCRRIRDLHVRGDIVIHTCRLALIELANALRFTRGLTAEDVNRSVEAVKALDVALADEEDLLRDSVRMAFERGVTVYDGLYVALARKLGSKLVTYDKTLLDKLKGEALTANEYLGMG